MVSLQVIPHPRGGWAVRWTGSERATSLHETQAAAVDRARTIARTQGTDVVVHRRDGMVSDSDTLRLRESLLQDRPRDRNH